LEGTGRARKGVRPVVARGLPPAAWLLGGFLIALAPWLAFVASGFSDFVDQQRTHGARFDLLDPRFAADNVLGEAHRYAPLLHALARGRPGPWLFTVLVAAGLFLLARRRRRMQPPSPRLLAVAIATVVVLYALLLQLKLFTYLSLLWPLLALAAAAAWLEFWRTPVARLWKGLGLALVVLASLEGANAYSGFL